MIVAFLPDGWDDYLHWQRADKKTLRKVNALIGECRRAPLEGTGKPEPLRANLAGWWSRRIDHEHRLVYRVRDGAVEVAQCWYHY